MTEGTNKKFELENCALFLGCIVIEGTIDVKNRINPQNQRYISCCFQEGVLKFSEEECTSFQNLFLCSLVFIL